MELVHALEQTAQLFLGVHAPLVGCGLQPDDAVPVKVGLIDTPGHGQSNHQSPVLQFHLRPKAEQLCLRAKTSSIAVCVSSHASA